ncbi:hypothetical protein BDV95DRAFT_117516 [Massariosphaeria phaeospora]|uniref:Uncharacterized protein n=1 Tax=Massariosphaeria phaeospora TaxID=100035 RepID=A0A7C8I5F2_9PLEO|nr:hypothetical protein BDV95DRAFT_117516 [Massariosphaeria phaeospora]
MPVISRSRKPAALRSCAGLVPPPCPACPVLVAPSSSVPVWCCAAINFAPHRVAARNAQDAAEATSTACSIRPPGAPTRQDAGRLCWRPVTTPSRAACSVSESNDNAAASFVRGTSTSIKQLRGVQTLQRCRCHHRDEFVPSPTMSTPCRTAYRTTV